MSQVQGKPGAARQVKGMDQFQASDQVIGLAGFRGQRFPVRLEQC